MKDWKAEAGSISHGTMRLEDLIPCFLGELDRLREARSFAEHRLGDAERYGIEDDQLGEIERRMTSGGIYFESEEAEWDLIILIDMLEDFAPEGHYFGAHEGDGSDYGYWEYDGCAEGGQA